jgi:hypothetical protein
VESYWYKDGKQWSYDGSARRDNSSDAHIWAGKGWAEPGHWEVGTYTVKVYLRKQLIAQKSFDIVQDENLPGALRYDGVYYFKFGPEDTWFLKFREDGTVNDLWAPKTANRAVDESLWYDIMRCMNTKDKSPNQLEDCYKDYYHAEWSKNYSGGIGTYQVNGSQIEFTLQPVFNRNGGPIYFNGTIAPTSLQLNWKVEGTGTGRFIFAKCPFLGGC